MCVKIRSINVHPEPKKSMFLHNVDNGSFSQKCPFNLLTKSSQILKSLNMSSQIKKKIKYELTGFDLYNF